MEIKKSPKADLEDKKLIFLMIGLSVALGIALAAFSCGSKPEIEPYEATVKDTSHQELDMMARTDQTEPEKPKEEQKKVQTKVLTDALTIVSNDTQLKVEDLMWTEDASDFDDFEFDMKLVEEEEDADSDIFTVLADPATFQGGGIAEFRKWVMSKMKYPQIAQENGIQGNVVIEFVVDEQGKIGRIKVLQSPDPVLTDAAVKVLEEANKPKKGWKPGKQRGKDVKQKFVLPVAFKLQQ